MVFNIKKRVILQVGKKVGINLPMKKVIIALVAFDKVTKRLDKLEEKGYIGSWNSGKKFKLIKKINSKIVSVI